MEGATSARRLASLLGDVQDDRPPRYAALAGRVRVLVADGRLPVGSRLPAERELAAAVGLSRATVTAAYARLRDDGWATARQGAGTWTALPRGGGRGGGPWVPTPPGEGVLDLVHAAPAAPPEVPAAYAAALEALPRLLPGHGYAPSGLPELRARIAERYAARGVPTAPEQVLVTGGGLHGVSLALEVLGRRGDRVLVEHPTYPNAVDAARHAGLRTVAVAVVEDDPDASVAGLAAAAAEARPVAAYVVPDFQNPTGQLLDEEQRARLAAALRRSRTRAVVDETLVELGLDTAAPPPFAVHDAAAVSIGSLSKAVWGGLRIGWVRAEADVVARLADVAARVQVSQPALEQLAACALLDGLDRLLAVRREELRVRRDVLRGELATALPGWGVPRPRGGLVLWCRLPSRRSTALVAAAEDRGLRLAAGPRFGTGHAFDDRLRLPYTALPDVLRRAVALLAEADEAATAGPRPRDAGRAPVI